MRSLKASTLRVEDIESFTTMATVSHSKITVDLKMLILVI